MARVPDLGKLLTSFGTSSSSSPLCVPALFFPYLYFPCGDAQAGSEQRRCETDDGEDKRGFVRDLLDEADGGLQWWQGDDHRWRVWNNAGLTHSAAKEPPVSSLFFSSLHFSLTLSLSLSHNFNLTKSPSDGVAFYFTTGWDWAQATHGDYFHRSPCSTARLWRASSDNSRQMKV